MPTCRRTDDVAEFVPLDIWHESEPGRFEEFRAATQAARLSLSAGLPGRVFGTGKAAVDRGHRE